MAILCASSKKMKMFILRISKALRAFFEPLSPEYRPRLKELPVFLTLKKPDFGVSPRA